MPMWLVDGGIGATWQAELGYNYDVVSYQDRFSDAAGWESHEVTETRVRWEPRVGRLNRAYQNIPAPALEGFGLWRERLGDYDQALGLVSPTLERRFQRAQSEHYDLHGAQPYQAELLGDAIVRLPNRAPRDAWADAARGFRDAAADECRQAAGADDIREFGWSPQFGQLHWTQLLLPVYTTYYLDDQAVVRRVLVHGQTGRASGPRRASVRSAWLRALLVLVAAIGLIVAAALLAPWLGMVLPSISSDALGIALVVALLLVGQAISPFVTVARFNRRQEKEPEIV
jgi:hypothetical protein